jgi:hypothetical protein
MYELPRRCAERPHIDLERIVQAAVGENQESVGRKLLRNSDLDKMREGGLTSAFLVPMGNTEQGLSKTNPVGGELQDKPASKLLPRNLNA